MQNPCKSAISPPPPPATHPHPLLGTLPRMLELWVTSGMGLAPGAFTPRPNSAGAGLGFWSWRSDWLPPARNVCAPGKLLAAGLERDACVEIVVHRAFVWSKCPSKALHMPSPSNSQGFRDTTLTGHRLFDPLLPGKRSRAIRSRTNWETAYFSELWSNGPPLQTQNWSTNITIQETYANIWIHTQTCFFSPDIWADNRSRCTLLHLMLHKMVHNATLA